MFERKKVFYGWILAIGLSIFFALTWNGLKFNYNFENFFSRNDPDLDFYMEFREKFENDNDYLLIALNNEPNIFNPEFIERAVQIETEIKSLENVQGVMSLLSFKEPIIGPFGISYRPLLDWSDEESLNKTAKKLMMKPYWQGNFINEKGNYMMLLLENKQMISKEEGDTLYFQVKRLLDESPIDQYHLAGKIKAQGEFVRLLQIEFSFFFMISGFLILLLLWVLFRTWWGVVLPMVVIGFGMFWTLAFLLWTGGELDVLMVMLPPILLVIGLSGMVHFFNQYLYLLKQGKTKNFAILSTFKKLGLAVFLTALTTALGFISLYFTFVNSLSWFGIYTGMGVLFMFLAMVLILPASLYLLPPFSPDKMQGNSRFWRRLLLKTFTITLKNGLAISLIFLLISLMAAFSFSRIKTDGYLLDNLPDGHPLVKDFEFFDEEFGGSKPLLISLWVGDAAQNLLEYEVLEELDKLEDFVKRNFETGFVVSPLTLIKGINKAQNSGNPNAFTTPSRGQLERMQPYLSTIIKENDQKLLSADLKSGRLTARMADMGSHKSKKLNKKLEDFVNGNINSDLLNLRLTGTSYLIDRSHQYVTQQVFYGLGFAFLLVGLIVGLLFKSWKMALVVLVPNIIPLLWVGGVMYWAGMDFKLSTSIIFAIAFGIAVDDSIHFMTKLRLELKSSPNLIMAIKRTYFTTGKAIILTTFILSSGFLVLIFSQFEIVWFTGALVSLALVFALIGDLVWLPVLLLCLKNESEKK
ncbi:MAG: MMPL family transporter [Cyclobacteriaceae bacterium]